MPNAVIFDLDGTLLDSVDLHALAWQEAMVEFGHAGAGSFELGPLLNSLTFEAPTGSTRSIVKLWDEAIGNVGNDSAA